MATKLTTYGPGKRAKEHPFEGCRDHSAIVLERDKKTVTHLGHYSDQPYYLHVGRTATLEFDAWHSPTPDVPPIRMIDLYYQHARRLGATQEAVDVLRSVLSNLTEEECDQMVATANAAKEAAAPKNGAVAGVKAPAAPKAPTKVAAPKAPGKVVTPKAEAKTSAKPAAAPKAPAKAAASKAEKVFTFLKAPKDKELPPQAVVIMQELKTLKKATMTELTAAVDGKISTKQPVDRIIAFYQKKLVEGGFVKLS
jgi:hypothetical protein